MQRGFSQAIPFAKSRKRLLATPLKRSRAMAEILSQDEIDSLLAALSTGAITAESVKTDEETRSIKSYDFKRPERFSKDQIHTLQMIHDSFSRLFAVSLSSYLRTLVEIKVVSLDQLTYEEFIRSIPNPTNINILSLSLWRGMLYWN